MKAWEYLRQLSKLPARGAGTDGERQAADWLRRRLTELGYDVEMQSFGTPRHTLYVGPALVAAVLTVSVVLAGRWPVPAFILALLCFVPLIGELTGSGPNFDLLLPKAPSQNVLGWTETAEGDETLQDVVVVAHYDVQWGSWLFAPGFRPFLQPFFFVAYGSFALGLAAVVVRWAAPDAKLTSFVSVTAVALLAASGGFLFLSYMTGRAVPGANDNGSGVAVALAVAEQWMQQPLPNLRLFFLFTGAEEVGLRGMHHFMKSDRGRRLRPGTIFVNLDNVGGGRLRYLLGEGMVGYQHYDAALVSIAARIAETYDSDVQPLQNLVLPTDALVPAKAGYPAITFLATRTDESIPNYHWHTDTFENAERDTVEQTERFVKKYIEVLAEKADMKSF